MVGLGTIVNALAIIVGGIIGCLFKNIIPTKVQNTVIQAMGLGIIFIGISGTLSNMLVIKNSHLSVVGSMMLIISLAIGTIIGELIDIDHWLNKMGKILEHRFSSSTNNKFSEGFIISSLTVSIGGFAVVGALQDGLNHDPSLLFTKASIDFVIVLLFAVSYGIGCSFSSIMIVIFEGGVTALAIFIKPILTANMIVGISLVGSALITLIGINMLLSLKIKVANLLPSLIMAAIYINFFGLH